MCSFVLRQTVGSNVCECEKGIAETQAAQNQGLQMSGAMPLTPGLHRQQAAVVRERQAAPERLGGGQRAENKKEPLSQTGMSFWIPTQCIL